MPKVGFGRYPASCRKQQAAPRPKRTLASKKQMAGSEYRPVILEPLSTLNGHCGFPITASQPSPISKSRGSTKRPVVTSSSMRKALHAAFQWINRSSQPSRGITLDGSHDIFEQRLEPPAQGFRSPTPRASRIVSKLLSHRLARSLK